MYHQPDISVIIPCYNSQAYLKKAVDSVLKQTHQSLQIILVDDGSTDKTGTLLQQYKMQDNRIDVITHSKNFGLGAARNTGIANARGTYIFFLDSDDYIHPNTFEVLFEQAKIQKLDILQSQIIKHSNKQKLILPENMPFLEQAVDGISYFHQGFFMDPKACGKLWRTAFMRDHNLKFDTGYYEDLAMVFYAFSIADKVNNITFPAYHYIVRPNSITQQKITQGHIDGYTKALIQLQELFLRPVLTDSKSSFPASYFLYLKDLSLLALKSGNPGIINNTKLFVNKMTQKYRPFLKGNQLLNPVKRRLLQQSPFMYASLKRTLKKT